MEIVIRKILRHTRRTGNAKNEIYYSIQTMSKMEKNSTRIFRLKHKAYPLFQYESIYHNPNMCSQIQNTINILTKDMLQIVKDHIIVSSIQEVEYRNKYGLLHTLPKKKIIFHKKYIPKYTKTHAVIKTPGEHTSYTRITQKTRKSTIWPDLH